MAGRPHLEFSGGSIAFPPRAFPQFRDGIAGAVAALKNSDGGPILVNGRRALVHALMEHELVDEFRLMIFPVMVGSGRRLFPETLRKTTLDLADTRRFQNGVVEHTYRSVSGSA